MVHHVLIEALGLFILRVVTILKIAGQSGVTQNLSNIPYTKISIHSFFMEKFGNGPFETDWEYLIT